MRRGTEASTEGFTLRSLAMNSTINQVLMTHEALTARRRAIIRSVSSGMRWVVSGRANTTLC